MSASTGRTIPVADPQPTAKVVLRSLLLRAVLPGLLAGLVLYAIGLLIMGPLGELPIEDQIAQTIAGGRTPGMADPTRMMSAITDTFNAIGSGIVYSLLVWALTRKWWLGLAPIAVLTLESSVFVPVTNIVDRPRPKVEMLDAAPPTSSFPSGHTAAAFALYLILFMLAYRIPQRLPRVLLQTLFLIAPFLVAYSRLYRGMHHVSDVVIGGLFGLWCAWTIAHALPGVWPWSRTKVDAEADEAHPSLARA